MNFKLSPETKRMLSSQSVSNKKFEEVRLILILKNFIRNILI